MRRMGSTALTTSRTVIGGSGDGKGEAATAASLGIHDPGAGQGIHHLGKIVQRHLGLAGDVLVVLADGICAGARVTMARSAYSAVWDNITELYDIWISLSILLQASCHINSLARQADRVIMKTRGMI